MVHSNKLFMIRTPPRSITFSGSLPMIFTGISKLKEQMELNRQHLKDLRLYVSTAKKSINLAKRRINEWRKLQKRMSSKKNLLEKIPKIMCPRHYYGQISKEVKIFFELKSVEDFVLLQHDNSQMLMESVFKNYNSNMNEVVKCCNCCLTNFNKHTHKGRSLFSTLCNHHVCNVCILNLLCLPCSEDYYVKCPVCRKRIFERPIDFYISY